MDPGWVVPDPTRMGAVFEPRRDSPRGLAPSLAPGLAVAPQVTTETRRHGGGTEGSELGRALWPGSRSRGSVERQSFYDVCR